MLAVVVRDGKPVREDIDGTLDGLQSIVGGYVQPFFTAASPLGKGELTGYVNEEGLMLGLPVGFGVVHSPTYVMPLAGNAVIVGLGRDGETRGLSEPEAERVLKSFRTILSIPAMLKPA